MIAIIDYGLGNIRAFANIYKRLNLPHRIASRPADMEGATKLILPGVGAFDEAMGLLQASGMRETLDDMVLNRKVPVLGICVGMQMLARSSDEGRAPGLGWIDGEVRKFDVHDLPFVTRLPHMGWNTVRPRPGATLLQGLPENPRFYFLHSYYFRCHNPADIAAEADYGGTFTCAVSAGNVHGVQFHPEKSHSNGVRLLQNFGESPC